MKITHYIFDDKEYMDEFSLYIYENIRYKNKENNIILINRGVLLLIDKNFYDKNKEKILQLNNISVLNTQLYDYRILNTSFCGVHPKTIIINDFISIFNSKLIDEYQKHICYLYGDILPSLCNEGNLILCSYIDRDVGKDRYEELFLMYKDNLSIVKNPQISNFDCSIII